MIKFIKVLKYIGLAIIAMFAMGILTGSPDFAASGGDIFLYRMNNFISYSFCIILPIIILSKKTIRNKVPFFNKYKLKFTIIGWVAMVTIGVIVSSNMDNIYSKEFIVAQTKYNSTTEAERTAADQAIKDAEIKKVADAAAAEKAKVDAAAAAAEKIRIAALETPEQKAAKEKAIADKAKADAAAKAAKTKADQIAAAAKKKADAAAAKKADDAKLAALVKETYKLWVDNQFSAWNGENIYLVEMIKNNLNDAKSFEHVKTGYTDKGDYLIIKMTYRAKNGFGALILQNITAKADFNTNKITVISQND